MKDMKVIDILKNEEAEIDENKLVFSATKSHDYVISVPHSGTPFPADMEDKLLISREFLERTDLYTESLYDTEKGIKIVSRVNRFLVNVGRFRKPKDDASLPGHLRVDALSETKRLGKGARKTEYSESGRQRLLKFYDRYHALLTAAIEETKKRNGFALVFDCHSMASRGPPGTPDEGKERPGFGVGTLGGTSASPRLISAFCETLRSRADGLGLGVKKDRPYRGGFITMNYGNPENGAHVIQIETRQSSYMDEDTLKAKQEDLKEINSVLSAAIEAAAEEARNLQNNL